MDETDPGVPPYPKYLTMFLFWSCLAAATRFRLWKISWLKLLIFAIRRLHEAKSGQTGKELEERMTRPRCLRETLLPQSWGPAHFPAIYYLRSVYPFSKQHIIAPHPWSMASQVKDSDILLLVYIFDLHWIRQSFPKQKRLKASLRGWSFSSFFWSPYSQVRLKLWRQTTAFAPEKIHHQSLNVLQPVVQALSMEASSNFSSTLVMRQPLTQCRFSSSQQPRVNLFVIAVLP